MITSIAVACAGRGTRMGELTKDTPKPLIEVCGKPFIYFLLKNIKQAGYERIILVVGYKKEKFFDFQKKYSNEFELEIVDQDLVGQKYGTAIPIIAVEKIIKDEQFVYAMGDNLYGKNDLKRAMKFSGNAVYGVLGDTSRYGVLVEDTDHNLIDIKGKTEKSETGIVNSALYTFKKEVFELANQVPISPKGEYKITDALLKLAEDKKIKLQKCVDPWLDFGRPEDIKIVENFLNHADEK